MALTVDDGSKDNSGIICDEWAAKDQRIEVIHKVNGGLSDARNAGLDKVKGEYIFFVDGDDYVLDDLGCLVNTVKNGCQRTDTRICKEKSGMLKLSLIHI